jgi:NAD(P) transhydrogenase subunit alpha
MARTVFVAKERSAGETRVAASPETVKKMAGLGLEIVIERGAGEGSKLPDTEFEKAGARIGSATDAANADVVLKVRRPEAEELSGYIVVAIMDPYGNDEALRRWRTGASPLSPWN